MRKHSMRVIACIGAAIVAGLLQRADAAGLPLQLEARVPFEPTAFSSGGRTYLCYEIFLTNFSPNLLTLNRIQVVDADGDSSIPVTTIEGDQLDAVLTVLRPFVGAPGGKPDVRELGAGATVVAFMWISFDGATRVPNHLRHRIETTDDFIQGTIIGTHHTDLHLLAPPVHGTGWTASDGPSNAPDNHHRRGVLAMNGKLVDSRRYAIDWMLYKDGGSIAYGEPVFAVDDATVVNVKDGLPDNTPAPPATFHPAVPITLDTVGGNMVLLDLGGGQYAWYCHLKPGSIRVKAGDHVRRGQPLAQIGISGDSPIAHLHFEVTTSPVLIAGDGVPYLIDRYQSSISGNAPQTRTDELPLDGMLIDFGNRP